MKWCVDFTGYCYIDAESVEEAENKFWEKVEPVYKNNINVNNDAEYKEPKEFLVIKNIF